MAGVAYAQSNLSVNVRRAPLTMAMPPSVTADCAWAPGTVVMGLATEGGNGNAVAYALSPTGGDFAISGSNLVVGPSGIAPTHCGITQNVTITPSQP